MSQILQKQLANFRRENNLIEPLTESANIKERLIQLDQDILLLESENKRIDKFKSEILNGKVNLTSSQTDGFGLRISDSDDKLLTEFENLKSELAIAVSKYKSTSSFVVNLKSLVPTNCKLIVGVKVDTQVILWVMYYLSIRSISMLHVLHVRRRVRTMITQQLNQ